MGYQWNNPLTHPAIIAAQKIHQTRIFVKVVGYRYSFEMKGWKIMVSTHERRIRSIDLDFL